MSTCLPGLACLIWSEGNLETVLLACLLGSGSYMTLSALNHQHYYESFRQCRAGRVDMSQKFAVLSAALQMNCSYHAYGLPALTGSL